ncbi:hypothetical protein AB670_03153 [Chryseobacterium sp. MOF25P]|uniref:hypothetical protein n=1 Tax=unclassified Chryseobacterium TaxID=2593645 RepID=UPI000805BB16|nr:MULTISPECIES: hypothetical protein [unclassified Chryseobacterium]OBW40489.1 hypothetical protein AB670_03153 [Chryseobacterium sp. MOF25P]OBW46767.1 hypothetical protein AB671_01118 [Chryseobacterium sp. BGARF1]
MRNIFFLLVIVFVNFGCQTKKTIVSSKPFDIQRNILTIRENEKVYVLIADNNDIIEVFNPPFNKSTICKKIVLNKKYNFRVFPVSDLIQRGIESPNEYILNDSTIIKYNNYYSLEKFELLCK